MNKVILGAILAGTLVLTGCSSKHTTIEQVQADVQTVQVKVDNLQAGVEALQEDTAIAQDEAARANQRLDNQAKSYRK